MGCMRKMESDTASQEKVNVENREEVYGHLPRGTVRGVGICDPHRSQLGGLLRSSGSKTVLAVSRIRLLSHDFVSYMSHGPDWPMVAVVMVVGVVVVFVFRISFLCPRVSRAEAHSSLYFSPLLRHILRKCW